MEPREPEARPVGEDVPRDPVRDEPGQVPVSLSDEDRLQVVFAYAGPLSVVPLLGSADPFVRWHARQGLALFVSGMVLMVLLYPFDWLFSLVPLLGRLFRAVELSLLFAWLALAALALSRALAGGRFRIPWLADLADQE